MLVAKLLLVAILTVEASGSTELKTLNFQLRHIDPNRRFVEDKWPVDNIFACALVFAEEKEVHVGLKGFNFSEEELCHLYSEVELPDLSITVDRMFQLSLPLR